MRHRIRMLLGVLLLTFALTSAGCWPFGPRTGKVDITKIVNQSARAKKYQAELNTKYQSLVAGLKEKNLAPTELKKKQDEAYAEYQKLKTELEARLDREISQEVQRVAKEKSLEVVLFAEAVRYGGVDITNEVISRLK